MDVITLNIADLSPDPANARKHGPRNLETIMGSLRRFGQQKPIVVDKSNVVRAGNGTLEAARALGWETIQAIQTDLTGAELTAYAIADNRTAELAEWDEDILRATLEGLQLEDEELLDAAGFDEGELEKMLAEIEGIGDEHFGRSDGEEIEERDSPYTNKITAPIYEPKGERPAVSDLIDRSKADKLIAEIDASKIQEPIKVFMRDAAERHVVFNFRSIAEFYCHADKELQHLMERSGLIIIDFDKAIQNGFVHMTEQLGKLADIELSERDDAS